ncbi:MAG: hypothetical protein JOY99_10765 [Sphingomonadaceae bacterium]|nr:hypothetical protein [Sphingomonadaceae bacterium]
MDFTSLLVTIVMLVMAGVFLALWNRRDRGDIPADDLAESPAPGRHHA